MNCASCGEVMVDVSVKEVGGEEVPAVVYLREKSGLQAASTMKVCNKCGYLAFFKVLDPAMMGFDPSAVGTSAPEKSDAEWESEVRAYIEKYPTGTSEASIVRDLGISPRKLKVILDKI